MTYQSVISKVDSERLISLLMQSLPEKDLGYGPHTSMVSNDESLHRILPAGYLSNAMFPVTLRRIIFDHVSNNNGRSISIAEHREQIADTLADLRTHLSDYIINEQQKEMSLEFFESLDSENGTRRPTTTNRHNYKAINTSIQFIEKAFILFERHDHASLYLRRLSNPNINYANERYKRSDLYLTDKDDEIAAIFLDGALIYNSVCHIDDSSHMYHAYRLLEKWVLSSLSYIKLELSHIDIEHESLGKTVNTDSVVLALAALINSKIKEKTGEGSARINGLIEMYLNDSTYHSYSEVNIEKIKEMAKPD